MASQVWGLLSEASKYELAVATFGIVLPDLRAQIQAEARYVLPSLFR